MNSGVKIGAKYKISSFIKYVFLIIMALFAAVPLFQVFIKHSVQTGNVNQCRWVCRKNGFLTTFRRRGR